MLNEQKLKQIQYLIQTSTVLTQQEKTEWLTLVELMNDKQISELEEILQKPKQETLSTAGNFSAANDSASKLTNETKNPSLSHISNLPNQISQRPQSMPPVRPQSPSRPVSQMPPMTPKPPVTSTPVISNPVNPKPQPRVFQDFKRPSPQPVAKVNPTPAVSAVPQQRQSINSVVEPVKLNSLEDVAKVTASVLHQQNREVFYKTITSLALGQGYFAVLTSFEQSPLYKDYLNFGKAMLSGSNQNLALSKEEFEFVTDILMSLKVNRT